jgi:putative transposase
MVDSHNPVYFRHKSIRLAEYDYASEGGYFITIVTYHRRPLFGRIVDDEMVLNDFGKIIKKEWFKTSKIRPSIELLDDEFVVMPNHIHGIIWITDRCRGTLHLSPCNGSGVHKSRQRAAVQHTGTQQRASTETYEQFGNPVSNSIPTIIRLFKATTTKQINLLKKTRRGNLYGSVIIMNTSSARNEIMKKSPITYTAIQQDGRMMQNFHHHRRGTQQRASTSSISFLFTHTSTR